LVATEFAGERKRVVVLGAGFGGATCAGELVKRLPKGSEVVVIDRNNYSLYYPLLIEAGVGTLEARHVTVPFRAQVPDADFRMAEILGVDFETKQVRFQVIGCPEPDSIRFDHLVFALGSVTKVPPIPGLKEYGFEMKALVDAIALRDRVIRLLELANTVPTSEGRRELLTFVVVGGNFTGIELAGEYHAFMQEARRRYPNVGKEDIRMIVLEYADRILPGTTESLAKWCSDTLKKRGVDIRLKTTVTEIGADFAQATDGERIPTRTVIWAAGIAPSPAIKLMPGLPVNKHGYIDCERDLRVKGMEGVWAIGDSATVLNPEGKPYGPTAQNASRQGPLCARNIVASMKGEDLKEFKFNPLGNFAAIGHMQAAAQVFGHELRGFLGWVMYRGAYLMKMPTFKLKLRLISDWIGELLIPHEPVQVGVHDERASINEPGAAEATTSNMPRAFLK
jgi:NADH dehydrogenase